ncbi:zinc metalloprotease [Nocardioides mangrovicus]|uniref:Zinc metalloprotease n=1 Tax=Nocardioides mangrovicus TaxID=2478913 RepID=A0A3L8P3H1_9ACTN|nr:zinc metalloprotease [Nocardioides mangrovicus]
MPVRVFAAGALVGVVCGGAGLSSSASAEEEPVSSHRSTQVVERSEAGGTMSAATARAVDRAVRSQATRRQAQYAPGSIVIGVRAHIIEGTHRGERHATLAGVRRQIAVLNQAYAGQEALGRTPDVNSTTTADTSFRFALRGVTKTRNEAWYHVSAPGATANRMKRTLHQGHAYTLNIYFVQPSRSSGLLGYATFPYQYAAHPRLDGLIVNDQSLPGGNLTHFNLGNTAVHEIGHWLGLRHVFNDQAVGSTEAPDPVDDCVDNDGLADTPVQAYPTSGDPVGKDTCVQDADHPQWVGDDAIHNFMDYSWDEAMYQFTPDQSSYMDLSWAHYRAPHRAS